LIHENPSHITVSSDALCGITRCEEKNFFLFLSLSRPLALVCRGNKEGEKISRQQTSQQQQQCTALKSLENEKYFSINEREEYYYLLYCENESLCRRRRWVFFALLKIKQSDAIKRNWKKRARFNSDRKIEITFEMKRAANQGDDERRERNSSRCSGCFKIYIRTFNVK
jgi:hypothetical protein